MKRNRTNKEDAYVGYKNSLFINEDLKDETEWTQKKNYFKRKKIKKNDYRVI